MTADVVAFRPRQRTVTTAQMELIARRSEERDHARKVGHWLDFAHKAMVADDVFRLNHALTELGGLNERHERRWSRSGDAA